MYEFGSFRVDTLRGLLLRGDDPVQLTGKCFEVLVVLIQNSQATVSKDALMKAVWPDTFVEESNLTQHISLLRKALGESPQDRLYIVTVPGQGYRFVADVREVRGGMQELADRELSPTVPPSHAEDLAIETRSTRRRTRLHILGFLAVVMVIAAARWLHQDTPAIALTEKDSILLADFDNSTGEPVFDGALKQGLAVELGQSPFLVLVGDDRVRETFGFMGKPPEEPLKLPVAREVCVRVGARALISGSISRLGNSYVLAVQAINCTDAVVLAREQAEARTKEDALPLLGKIASTLRGKLGESLNSVQQFGVPVEQATTPSLDALKSYSLAIAARAEGKERDAIPLLEHSIELDPKFAMAYAQLGATYRNLGETSRASDYIKQAFALRSNLSEREKLFLTVRYHNVVTGDIDKAADTYELWGRMYPRDWSPFNGLAAYYQVIGQYEKARTNAAVALKLQPNHYSPYANLALSELALNHLDEAQRACEQASAAGRDSVYTHRVLFEIAFLRHDQATMQHQIDWATGTERENDMLTTRALALTASGKLRASRQLFEQSWATSQRLGLDDDAAYSMAGAALTDADFGNYPQARTQAVAALKLGRGIDVEETAAEALALVGDTAQAQDLSEDLQRRFPKHAPLNVACIPTILATIALRRGEPAKAIEILQPAAPYDLSEFCSLSPIYIRGLAYLRAASGGEAAAEFQKIVDHPGIDATSPRHALANLGLARAYKLIGDSARSRQAYQEFFAAWSGADSDIPELRKAHSEYQHLE